MQLKFLKRDGDLLMNKSLKEMSQRELRAYILEHRNDEEKVRAAIAESMSRPGWTEVPADTPLEEERRIIQDLISKKS